MFTVVLVAIVFNGEPRVHWSSMGTANW